MTFWRISGRFPRGGPIVMGVYTEGVLIAAGAPLARRFRGQPLQNLKNWLRASATVLAEDVQPSHWSPK